MYGIHYTREVEGRSYTSQKLCNSIATVWEMQTGRKKGRTIDSCTNDPKGARLPSRLPLLSLVVVPEPTCSPAASSLSEAAEREREREGERAESSKGISCHGQSIARNASSQSRRRCALAFTRYLFTSIARLLDNIRLPFRPPVCMLYTILYW